MVCPLFHAPSRVIHSLKAKNLLNRKKIFCWQIFSFFSSILLRNVVTFSFHYISSLVSHNLREYKRMFFIFFFSLSYFSQIFFQQKKKNNNFMKKKEKLKNVSRFAPFDSICRLVMVIWLLPLAQIFTHTHFYKQINEHVLQHISFHIFSWRDSRRSSFCEN